MINHSNAAVRQQSPSGTAMQVIQFPTSEQPRSDDWLRWLPHLESLDYDQIANVSAVLIDLLPVKVREAVLQGLDNGATGYDLRIAR